MNYNVVKELLLLDLLRTEEIKPDYYLKPIFDDLEADGYLSDGRITEKGKRTLLEHLADQKEIAEPLDRYKEVVIGGKTRDLRMPFLAYVYKSKKIRDIDEIITIASFAVNWQVLKKVFKSLIGIRGNWQKALASDFIYEDLAEKGDCWKTLGPTEEESEIIGKWLLNPYGFDEDYGTQKTHTVSRSIV